MSAPPQRLRVARPADGAALAAIYAPYVRETAISFELAPPTAQEMADRIRETLVRYPWLVGEDRGQVVGYAYAGPYRRRAAYRWSVEVSVYVAPAAQGRGLGRALYAALLVLLEAQGFRQAFAGMTLPNPASEGLHAALGFEPLGTYRAVGFKDDRWHDVAWTQRPLGLGAEGAPAEPIRFPRLPRDRVAKALARGGDAR